MNNAYFKNNIISTIMWFVAPLVVKAVATKVKKIH